MRLEIQEYNPEELEARLLRDELDLIYTVGNTNPALCRIPVAVEPANLLMNQDNPLAKHGEITAETLSEQTFLISSMQPLPDEDRAQIAAYLGHPPRYHIYQGTFEQGLENVRSNEGILFCGVSYCIFGKVQDIAVIPFPDRCTYFRHFLDSKKGRKLPEPVRCLLDECRTLSDRLSAHH